MDDNEDIDSIEEENVNENSMPNESSDFGHPIEVKSYTQPEEALVSNEPIKSEDFGQPQDTTDSYMPVVEAPVIDEPKATEAPTPDLEPKVEKNMDEPQAKKLSKKHIIKKILLFLFIVILIAAAAAGAYLWRDKEAKAFEQTQASNLTSLKSELAQTNVKLVNALAENSATGDLCTTNTECVAVAPSAATIENIKASITSSNLAALEGYMTSSVSLASAASSTVSLADPTQAISNIAAFTADVTLPWNFSITSSTLSSYGAGSFGTYFESTSIVGKSANNKVISISFDCKGKIDTVFMASKESLLE